MPLQVRASHILLAHDESAQSTATLSKEEALRKTQEIKAEIDGGGDFAALARTHSDCPSGADGGDLGSFGRDMMVPEFEDVAFALEVDATSDVVETEFGYHLIRRTE